MMETISVEAIRKALESFEGKPNTPEVRVAITLALGNLLSVYYPSHEVPSNLGPEDSVECTKCGLKFFLRDPNSVSPLREGACSERLLHREPFRCPNPISADGRPYGYRS